MAIVEVSARIGALIVHAAAIGGVEPAAFKAVTGFDAALAQDPDARIPFALEQTLWNEAARLTADAVSCPVTTVYAPRARNGNA